MGATGSPLFTRAATPCAAAGQKLHHVPVASSTITLSRGTCWAITAIAIIAVIKERKNRFMFYKFLMSKLLTLTRKYINN
jgi:hypothetical protein